VANDPVSKEWKIIIVSSRSQMKTRSRLLSGLLGEGLFWRRPRPLLDREATSLPPLPSRVRLPLPLPPGPAVSVFTGDTGPFSDSWNPLGLSVGTKEANSYERRDLNYHTATLSKLSRDKKRKTRICNILQTQDWMTMAYLQQLWNPCSLLSHK